MAPAETNRNGRQIFADCLNLIHHHRMDSVRIRSELDQIHIRQLYALQHAYKQYLRALRERVILLQRPKIQYHFAHSVAFMSAIQHSLCFIHTSQINNDKKKWNNNNTQLLVITNNRKKKKEKNPLISFLIAGIDLLTGLFLLDSVE